MSESEPRNISGILVVDKPLGMTSMGVCAKVRGRLHAGLRKLEPEQRAQWNVPKRIKVGHGGTLDPLATGVLVVLVGKATKACEAVMKGAKEYVARVDLARVSPTDDLEAEATLVEGVEPVTRDRLEGACGAFVGDIEQAPPAHSAVKVGGERAYAVARRGDDPGLKTRRVRIDAIEVVQYEWPVCELRIACGKGVYIRSLARDLGSELGAGGVLVGLRRTRVGRFVIEDSVTMDDLPNPMTPRDLGDLPASVC